jgi:hypothetical protein
MELNRLTHDADDLIRKVVSRYNQLYVPSGSISQVELDLILDDLRNLYDTFKTIGQINLTLKQSTINQEVTVNAQLHEELAETPTPSALAEKPSESKESPIMKQQSQPEPETEDEGDFVDEAEFEVEATHPVEKGIPATEPYAYSKVPESQVISEITSKVADEPAQEATETNAPLSNPGPASATLADTFKANNRSLSDTIATSQAQENMGSRLLFQPIADLASGIGLNEKFHFMSELFASDPARYEEAISRINKAVNLDEANWILQKYHLPEWDTKHETLARLKDFIKRRFI